MAHVRYVQIEKKNVTGVNTFRPVRMPLPPRGLRPCRERELYDAGNLCTCGLGSLDRSRLKTVASCSLSVRSTNCLDLDFLMEFLENSNKTKCSAAIEVEYNTEHVFNYQCTHT